MSLLVVILLVSVATVVSYALLRSQSTAVHIQQNADLRASARQAAISGLSYGLWAMHQEGWGGVDTTQTRTLGTHEQFTVSFTAGDTSLQPGNSDYEDYPYRVTIQSTGYAEDPLDATRNASHTIHSVVRLIPRALSTWTNFPNDHATWPMDWHKMEGFTVYQTRRNDTNLEIPCRLQGNVRLQKRLYLGVTYPTPRDSSTGAWYNYLYGLRKMLETGYPDYRPINGKLYIPYDELDSTYRTNHYARLYSALNFSREYPYPSSSETEADFAQPTTLSTYRIYPGGPVYDVGNLSGSQTNLTLEPDPITNPLGLFHLTGVAVSLQGSTSVRGTLFCDGDVTIQAGAAQSAEFNSVNMPALCGSTAPVRQPVLTTKNLIIASGSSTTITGLVAAFGDFEISETSAAIPFSLTGRLVAPKITVKKRQPFDTASWTALYVLWQAQSPSTPFPVWLKTREPTKYDYVPKVTMVPDPAPVQYDWNNWSNPVYMPHDDDDGGLRWEMLVWKEGAI